jgi:alanyl-tRNA synthetase
MSTTPKSTAQIRQAFIEFFQAQKHTLVPSAPLPTYNDSTLLFVNSGMAPFKLCFTGEETRGYIRATSAQKCLRVSGKHNDYSQIGVTPRHHTFFEMLGNFSFGDYFKADAITMAWKFVTEVLKFDKARLLVTVHEADHEGGKLWSELTDVAKDRIIGLGDDTNRWAMGEFGPNGYCSEIFYYLGENVADQSVADFLLDDGRYLEIWNLVFMQFNKREDGTVHELPKPCIDTGMGLERVAAVAQGKNSNYDIDIIRSIITKIEELTGKHYTGISYYLSVVEGDLAYKNDVAMRIIADHARSIAFLLADGVVPDNEGAGYVVRRLIRRAARSGQSLGLDKSFLADIMLVVATTMKESHPELSNKFVNIKKIVTAEEERFLQTLLTGLKLLKDKLNNLKSGETLSGEIAFLLYDTYGFPVDLTQEIVHDVGVKLDMDGFDMAMANQKIRSKSTKFNYVASTNDSEFVEYPNTIFTGYESLTDEATLLHRVYDETSNTSILLFDQTPFYGEKGGQKGDSGECTINGNSYIIYDTKIVANDKIIHFAYGVLKNDDIGKTAVLKVDQNLRVKIAVNHSGTHLLNAGLRKILGNHVMQKGSQVTDTNLRFDFNHDHALTETQLTEIEDFINSEIRQNHLVETVLMPLEDAMKSGAVAAFGEKYGKEVRIVTMGTSKELCGGTHVTRTGDIGLAVITNEGSISAGIRRIEATCGESARTYLNEQRLIVNNIAKLLKSPPAQVIKKIENLTSELKKSENEVKRKDEQIADYLAIKLADSNFRVANNTVEVVVDSVEVSTRESLTLLAERTLKHLKNGVVVVGNEAEGLIVVKVNDDKLNAGLLIKSITAQLQEAKGGGNKTLASVTTPNKELYFKALNALKEGICLI